MKAVIVEKQGASATIVDDFKKPEPADDQVLVKSIYTAINPVDAYMADYGLLVLRWPLVVGVDVGGIVVKAGPKAQGPLGALKEGDELLGCTRLGDAPYSTCQEYYLMDAALATPKPKNISLAEAATVGVGFYTACLGVFGGLNIPIPKDPKNLSTGSGELVLVLGGSSSVGKFAIQLLKALGYKAITTCSPRSSSMIKSLGAAETFDYKLSDSDLISHIVKLTDGKLARCFDAVASNTNFVKALYQQLNGEKYFSTTNDWDPINAAEFNGATINPVALGPIGQPDAKELNENITKFIPLIHHLIESGAVKPAEYEIIGETGFESVSKAWEYQKSGKAGAKKVLVKLQDE